MKKKILLLLLALCTSITLAGGKTQVALADNAVVGSGTPESCSEAALDAALAELHPGATTPGGVLSFECGPNPHTIVLTNPKTLQDGTVIDGGGLITLSGNASTRIFIIAQQAEVELHAINLINGFAATGGAIYTETNSSGNNTKLLLDTVSLQDNHATGLGGAIAAQATDLTISNSYLVSNLAENNGGALSLSAGSLILTNTEVLSNTANAGGGIYNFGGQVNLENARLRANQALYGGGVYNSFGSLLMLIDVTLADNSGSTGGGGLYNLGQVEMNQVTISENTSGDGGGIFNTAGAQIDLTNTTLSGNQASFGGGIFNNGSLDLMNVTIALNAAQSGGGGLLHNSGSNPQLTMVNTLLALNTTLGSGDQCLLYKPADSLLFSLWSGTSCGTSTSDGNLPNSIAQLGPLAFSGTGLPTELTMTHVFLAGSPAEDHGTCEHGAPLVDQRGVARPLGTTCDIGAVEIASPPPPVYYPVYLALLSTP